VEKFTQKKGMCFKNTVFSPRMKVILVFIMVHFTYSSSSYIFLYVACVCVYTITWQQHFERISWSCFYSFVCIAVRYIHFILFLFLFCSWYSSLFKETKNSFIFVFDKEKRIFSFFLFLSVIGFCFVFILCDFVCTFIFVRLCFFHRTSC